MTVTSLAGPDAYVASVSHEKLENWAIAKESGLWGTTSGVAKEIQPGDELFIWQSRSGWLARCLVMSAAIEVDDDVHVPWVDGTDYKWLFEIVVITEVDPVMPAVVNARQVSTDIPTVFLSRFSKLTTAQAAALRGLFPRVPQALQGPTRTAVAEPASGWGRSQDRARNKLIEQAGINTAISHYESMGYTWTGDRQRDGVGYDLEFTRGSEFVKLEVKGIAAHGLAFNLTEKERFMAETDPEFRLCAVTNALAIPVVEVLTGAELLNLDRVPTQYRVRRTVSPQN
jgi:hypothetical protein